MYKAYLAAGHLRLAGENTNRLNNHDDIREHKFSK